MRTSSAQHCGRKRRRKYCKQHEARAQARTRRADARMVPKRAVLAAANPKHMQAARFEPTTQNNTDRARRRKLAFEGRPGAGAPGAYEYFLQFSLRAANTLQCMPALWGFWAKMFAPAP